MNWRSSRIDYRNRVLAQSDDASAEQYDTRVGSLGREDEDAILSDLGRVFTFRDGMAVLDVGAGTGTMSKLLTRLGGLSMTALEPSRAMLSRLRGKPGLEELRIVEGFCDAPEDRTHFLEGQFDVILSRQLGNELFDPLAAFENWFYWLSPGGSVLLIDGLYDRPAWAGDREEEINLLPLSVHQTTALVPYLLEAAGFQIAAVEMMEATNDMPSTRTTRYVVIATKTA